MTQEKSTKPSTEDSEAKEWVRKRIEAIRAKQPPDAFKKRVDQMAEELTKNLNRQALADAKQDQKKKA